MVDLRHRMQLVLQAVHGKERPRGDQSRNVPVFAEGEHPRDHVAGTVSDGAVWTYVVVERAAGYGNADAPIARRGMERCHSASGIAKHEHSTVSHLGQRQSPIDQAHQVPHPLADHRAPGKSDLPCVAPAVAADAIGNIPDSIARWVAPHATRRGCNRQESPLRRLHGDVLIRARDLLPDLNRVPDAGVLVAVLMAVRGHGEGKRSRTVRLQDPEPHPHVRLCLYASRSPAVSLELFRVRIQFHRDATLPGRFSDVHEAK